ncbi:DUF2254 domain-containing protein [Curtobacterium oceanosedimentum]|uniref:DUF2254 domain-containing protein n=1 Tax=Curtobacterium oceanosedimentum TaxID=465820 RepID=UPI0007375ECB|nr:DUF2254 domain-containing protein [Curtobacterium oceanosedimentum]
MHALLVRVRESFWFLPALLGVVAIVVAQLLVTLDREVLDGQVPAVPFLDALSAGGGRSILTTIGTAMLTVAGTSFSITISVLATTSSTYGPRLVRNFTADRANQLVLAAFTSTFLYAMVVLRTVHTDVDDGDAFVPVVAIHVAVLLAVLDVGVLVFFIHHIASSTQITSLQRQVQTDLRAAVDEAYRDGDDERRTIQPVTVPEDGWYAVRAASDGYVQSVEWRTLTAWAVRNDRLVDVVATPGRYVIQGDVVVRVRVRAGGDQADRSRDDDSTPAIDAATSRTLRAAVVLGTARTPVQDVEFALQQLVEIAVRGLASGSNDPYTAVSALDMATPVLVPLWRDRSAVTALLGPDGTPRVLQHWPSPEDLVAGLFATVGHYGAGQPLVERAADRLAERLEHQAPEHRRGIAAGTRPRPDDPDGEPPG